jgi:hypothetical protein
MPYTLKIDRDTWLKLSPAESTTLLSNQKQAEPAGTILPISSYEIGGDHIKVSLGDNAQDQQIEYDNHNTWYVFKQKRETISIDHTALSFRVIISTYLTHLNATSPKQRKDLVCSLSYFC